MSELADIGNAALEHAGVKFRSGRFPYGSGERPHQHDSPWVYDDGEWDYKSISKDMNLAGQGLNTISNMADQANRSISNIQAPKKDYRPQARMMTDEELRNAINRMNMEKQYSQMMNEMNPQRRARSIETVAKVVGTAVPIITGTKLVYDIVRDAVNDKALKQEKAEVAANRKHLTEMFDSDPDYAYNNAENLDDLFRRMRKREQWLKAYEKVKDYV